MRNRLDYLGLGIVGVACAGATLFHGTVALSDGWSLYNWDSPLATPLQWLARLTLTCSLVGSALGLVSYVQARRQGTFSLLALLATAFGALVLTPSALYALWMAAEFGTHRVIPGRPLRRQEEAPEVPAEDQSPGAWWATTARAEHASVAAFERLAAELSALDAPEELVERCRQAAREEAGHARLAVALAERFLGERVVLPEVEIPPRAPDLAQIAAESLVDGVLNEGFAARLAQAGAVTAVDPEVKAALTTIASEEASHAALAADIVSWARAAGGEPVARAVADCRLPFPSVAPGRPQDGGVGRLRAVALGVLAFCETCRLGARSSISTSRGSALDARL